MQRAEPFSRTLRDLDGGGRKPLVALLAAAILCMAAWLLWFVYSDIPVQVVSRAARLEAAQQPFVVQASVAGRVETFAATLGAPVKKGQVLLRLDDAIERHHLAELEAELDGTEHRLVALGAQIAAEENNLALARRASSTAVAEATTRAKGENAVARQAEDEAARIKALAGSGVVASIDQERKTAEATSLRARSKVARLAGRRLRLDLEREQSGLAARVAELEKERALLEAEVAQKRAQVDRARAVIDQYEVRAPFDGVIGEAKEILPGQVVSQGERLATVVPEGAVRIVARFAPDTVGRLRAGQQAHLRLDAFPWMQHGTVAARVRTVATEPDGGGIRVELEVAEGTAALPLEHGQTGSVEVDVERASPAELVLRAAGFRLGREVD